MSHSERTQIARLRGRRRTHRQSLVLSLALHAAALWSILPRENPVVPAPGDVNAVELVMVPSPPIQAAEPPPPEPQAITADADQAAVPEPPPPPEPPVAAEPPAAPISAAAREPPPLPAAPATAAISVPPSPQSSPRPVHPPRPPSAARTPSVHPFISHAETGGMSAPAEPAAAPNTAAVPSAAAANPPTAEPDSAWLADVAAWLLAHRSYPAMARALGRQGTVVVQITVDADGRVADVNLIRGSGTESLDQAAQALVRNARLPPFPPDMKRPRQDVTVPIRYRLE